MGNNTLKYTASQPGHGRKGRHSERKYQMADRRILVQNFKGKLNQQSSNFKDGLRISGDYQDIKPEAWESKRSIPSKQIKPAETSTTSECARPSLNYESIGKGGVTFENSVEEEAEKLKVKNKADLSKEPSQDELIKYGSITR